MRTLKAGNMILGTVKRVEEFIMVETKDYTRMYLEEEFKEWIKERCFTVA